MAMAHRQIVRPAAGSSRGASDAGFSLIEVMIAMAVLATGLLSLAGVFVLGLQHLSNSSAALIAREKAREAVESVHTARDTRVIRWCQIYNVDAARNAACDGEAAAVFVTGMQPLRGTGSDGLVNTGDDEGIEEAVSPGPDNVLGNDDDVRTPLMNFRREIEITEIVTNGVANPNLRRLRVRIRYGNLVQSPEGGVEPERTYELTTFISSIS
jgi:prepilin-type N-terminal cleavage/methylation domain-containing protein